MEKQRRKLISRGGKHWNGKWVLRTRNCKVEINSENINWSKVFGYGIVIAFMFFIMVALIKYASENHGDDVIAPTTTTMSEGQTPAPETKATVSAKIVPLAAPVQYEPAQEAVIRKNDLVVELSSMKNQKINEAKVQAQEMQKEAVVIENETKIAAAENVAYVSAFSAGTEERIRIAMEIIVENGFTPEAAAAIVGNALVESQLKPEVANGTSFYGLFQWSSSWWEHIKEWLVSNGYDIYSYEGQIHAAIECPHYGCMTEARWETLKGLTNIDQATELFTIFYEGCVGGSDPAEYYSVGKCYQLLNLRKSEARQALNVYYGGEYTGSKPYYP